MRAYNVTTKAKWLYLDNVQCNARVISRILRDRMINKAMYRGTDLHAIEYAMDLLEQAAKDAADNLGEPTDIYDKEQWQ